MFSKKDYIFPNILIFKIFNQQQMRLIAGVMTVVIFLMPFFISEHYSQESYFIEFLLSFPMGWSFLFSESSTPNIAKANMICATILAYIFSFCILFAELENNFIKNYFYGKKIWIYIVTSTFTAIFFLFMSFFSDQNYDTEVSYLSNLSKTFAGSGKLPISIFSIRGG